MNIITNVNFNLSYSFLAQNPVFDFRWNNLQTTFYPFGVQFHKDPDVDKPRFEIFVVVINNLDHNTVTFQIFRHNVMQLVPANTYAI